MGRGTTSPSFGGSFGGDDFGDADFDEDEDFSNPLSLASTASPSMTASGGIGTFESEPAAGRGSPRAGLSGRGSPRAGLSMLVTAAHHESEKSENADDLGAIVIPESMTEFVDSARNRSGGNLWQRAQHIKEKALLEYLHDVQKQQADGQSDQDVEIMARMLEAQIAGACMISPNSTFRSRWDGLQAVFLSYIAFVVPYRIGFDNDATPESFWFWLDLFIDLYFITDVFLNFRTAFYSNDGEMEYRSQEVRSAYLHGWFTIDVLGCLPFNYVVYLIPDSHLNSSDMRGNKVLRMMRLARLLKILRLVRFKRLLERWEEELYNVSALKMLKLVVFIVVIGHWLSCAWYYFGNEVATERDRYGELLKGWVQNSFEGVEGVTQTDRYITSLYWSFMTLT